MKTTDILAVIGAAMLAVGPELQTQGGTELEWRLGRYMRVVGAALIGSRAVGSLAKPRGDAKRPKP